MPATRPRVPHARRDPIRTAADALAVVSLASASPPRWETIAFLLDSGYRGTGQFTVVSDTIDGDSVIRIAEVMGEVGALCSDAGDVDCAFVVIASVRPGSGLEQPDAFRWYSASDIIDDRGLELIEWFVLGPNGVELPRELVGDPERWP